MPDFMSVKNIQNLLYTSVEKIVLIWRLLHCCIYGNEPADGIAEFGLQDTHHATVVDTRPGRICKLP